MALRFHHPSHAPSGTTQQLAQFVFLHHNSSLNLLHRGSALPRSNSSYIEALKGTTRLLYHEAIPCTLSGVGLSGTDS